MFDFCRSVKKWIVAVVIWSHLQLSMACAAHSLWFEIDRPEKTQGLVLKISHAATALDGDVGAKALLAQYALTFQDQNLNYDDLSHGGDYFIFQEQTTPEACTISLSQDLDTQINLVVYKQGHVVVNALRGVRNAYQVNTCGSVITALDPELSTSVRALTLIGQNIINQQDLKVSDDFKATATGIGKGQGQIVNQGLVQVQNHFNLTGRQIVNDGILCTNEPTKAPSPAAHNTKAPLNQPSFVPFVNGQILNRGLINVDSLESQSLDFTNRHDIYIKDRGTFCTSSFNNSHSTLQTGQQLQLSTQTLNNEGGQIWGGSNAKIEVTGGFSNQKGTIGSQQTMDLVLHAPTQALGTLVAPQLSLRNPTTDLKASHGTLLATSWIELSALKAYLPHVDLQTPLCRLRVSDFQLSPQGHCLNTAIERDQNQSFELTHPYQTTGQVRIQATGASTQRTSYEKFQKPVLHFPQTFKIMANLHADGGLTVQGAESQLMIGSETVGTSPEILLPNGALTADVAQFVLDKGTVAALSADIKAPFGIHIGRLVPDATRECFATVYRHGQCSGSHSLGSEIHTVRYNCCDQTFNTIYDGRHLMRMPVMMANNTALIVKNLMQLEGALKLKGYLESQDCVLASNQDHECLASVFKIKNNLQFQGKGQLQLKRVIGHLLYTYYTHNGCNTFTNYIDREQTSSDPSVLRVDHNILSDQPITIVNHSGHLHFKAKSPHITIESQDFTAGLYQKFIGGLMAERAALSNAVYPGNLSRFNALPAGAAGLPGHLQPHHYIYAKGCLPWAVGFLLKTNNFEGAQQHFPAVTSSATATVLPANANRLEGNITMPQMLVLVGPGGVVLGSPQTYRVPPQAPVRHLTPKNINLSTTVVLDNLAQWLDPSLSSQAFQFFFRERFWFDEAGAQKFYHDLQDQVVIVTPQKAFKIVPKRALFSLSPRYLVDRIQEECQQVLKRGTIEEGRAIDAPYVQGLHRNMHDFIRKYSLDATSLGQALTHPSKAQPMPTQAMVYYESLRNDHGVDELCPRLFLPPAMIQQANAAVGSQITTNTLLILPQNVRPTQLVGFLDRQPALQQTVQKMLSHHPKQSRLLEQQVQHDNNNNNNALTSPLPTGSATLQGNFRIKDQLATVIGGSLISHADIKVVDAILVSLFDKVRVESKVERVGTGQGGDFVDHIPFPAQVAAKNIIEIFAGQDVIFKGARTDSGIATHIEALANVYDVPVELMSQRIEHFYGRTKGTQITRTSIPVVSHHHTGGLFHEEADGSIQSYGTHYQGKTGRLEAKDKVILGDVPSSITQETHLKKKGRGLLGKSKKFDQYTGSQTSHGSSLDFEKGLVRSDTSHISMTNPDLKGNITAQAPQGNVSVAAGVNQQMSSFDRQDKNLIWQKRKQNQQHHVTYALPQIEGTLTIEALGSHIQQVAGQSHPFLEKVRIAEGQLLTQTLYEIHKNETHKTQGLTPGASAVVALAAGIATAGVGSYVAGMAASLVPSAAAIGVGVAAQAMATGAIVSTVNNLGDPKAVLKDVTSSQALRHYFIEGLSAGILKGIGDYLKAPLAPSMEAGMRPAQTSTLKSFGDHLQAQLLRQGVRLPLNVVIGRQDMGEALETAVRQVVGNTVGGYMAQQIGAGYDPGTPKSLLEMVSHKVLHGLNGAVAGAILRGEKGIISGALGAITVESVAEMMMPNRAIIEARLKAGEDSEVIKKEVEHIADISRLIAASAALVTGQDVPTAIQTATLAVENNLLNFVVPVIVTAGAKVLWEAYNICFPEEIEGAKENLCQYIADETGLPVDQVRLIGEGVLMGTSVVNVIRKSGFALMRSLCKKSIQEIVRDQAIKTNQVANLTAANHSNKGKIIPKDKSKYPEGRAFKTGAAINPSTMNFATKNEARYHFKDSNPSLHKSVKEFFKGATGKSKDFKITPLENNRYKLEFFSPADTPNFGKRYVKVVDNNGTELIHKAYTMGPRGLIEVKNK